VITTPELAAVTDALRTIATARQFGKEVLGAVLTRHGSHEFEMSRDNIESMLGVPVLGVIPEDPNIALSARINSPVLHSHPHSSASQAYKELAASLLGERYKKISKEETNV
jgi:septum site-determining protein MinD